MPHMDRERRKRLEGCLAALGCETLFGLSYVFTKHASAAGTLPLLGWRFTIAFCALLIALMVKGMRIRLRGKRILPLLSIAILNPVIYFTAETAGIGMLTASESGAFLAGIPVFSLIASTLLLRKKPERKQVAGIMITLLGVLLTVYASGLSASFSAMGYAMLTLAVISYALYSVRVEAAEGYTGMEITAVMIVSGAAVFSSAAMVEALREGTFRELLFLPFSDSGFFIAVLYQGICCSILAFFLSNAAIARIGVNGTASFIGVSTAVSILGGMVFLGEPFTPFQTAGAAMILAGVYAANRG